MLNKHIKKEFITSREESSPNYLINCENCTELTIVQVNAGRKAKQRLANLGIVPGVKIIKRRAAPFRGPIEIEVKGSCLVLGRGIASKILVKYS
ncbi:MAG: FeoA family protein [Promethearchaeota archaeon]